jgi:hypothetical protein
MYVYKAPDLGLRLVQIINENSRFLTPRHIDAATHTRDLYKMIGRPSYANFMTIIQNNLLPNFNISVKDVENAQRIFGKDLGSKQGTTVRLLFSPLYHLRDYHQFSLPMPLFFPQCGYTSLHQKGEYPIPFHRRP